jgi:hypothetical protein
MLFSSKITILFERSEGKGSKVFRESQGEGNERSVWRWSEDDIQMEKEIVTWTGRR